MKKLGAILLLVVVILSSCAVKKKIKVTEISHDSTVVQKDSVHIEYRDTTYFDTTYLPTDQAYITALFECNSLGQVQMKKIIELKAGIRARPTIELRGDTVFVLCECDSAAIVSIFQGRFKREYVSTDSKVEVKDSTSIYEKIVKVKLPWWIWTIIGLGALLGVYKLYKKIM